MPVGIIAVSGEDQDALTEAVNTRLGVVK